MLEAERVILGQQDEMLTPCLYSSPSSCCLHYEKQRDRWNFGLKPQTHSLGTESCASPGEKDKSSHDRETIGKVRCLIMPTSTSLSRMGKTYLVSVTSDKQERTGAKTVAASCFSKPQFKA